MMAATKRLVPKELQHKVSSGLVGMAQQRKIIQSIFVAFAIFFLYGPFGRIDHNGTRYLLGSLIVPFVVASYFTLFPLAPYRGNPKRYGGGGTKALDRSDPESMRLLDIFRSSEAKRAVWRAAAKLSGILLGSVLVLMIFVRHSLSWSFYSWFLIPGTLGCLMCVWLATGVEYLEWGFKCWAKEQVDRRHVVGSTWA
jgi:hypothetical protein